MIIFAIGVVVAIWFVSLEDESWFWSWSFDSESFGVVVTAFSFKLIDSAIPDVVVSTSITCSGERVVVDIVSSIMLGVVVNMTSSTMFEVDIGDVVVDSSWAGKEAGTVELSIDGTVVLTCIGSVWDGTVEEAITSWVVLDGWTRTVVVEIASETGAISSATTTAVVVVETNTGVVDFSDWASKIGWVVEDGTTTGWSDTTTSSVMFAIVVNIAGSGGSVCGIVVGTITNKGVVVDDAGESSTDNDDDNGGGGGVVVVAVTSASGTSSKKRLFKIFEDIKQKFKQINKKTLNIILILLNNNTNFLNW